MITRIQKEWLEQILSGEINKTNNPRKYSAYMRRIQNRIDELLDNLVWLSARAPEILKNEEREFANSSVERHYRLKKLLKVCVDINPYKEDPTIFKILTQLVPQFGVEVYRKTHSEIQPLKVYKCTKCNGSFDEEQLKDNQCPYCKNASYIEID